MSRSAVVLLLLLTILNGAEGVAHLVALQWPPSRCMKLETKCNVTKVRSWSDFTIHGLWSLIEKDRPCPGESLWHFKSQIGGDARLEKDLEYTWPSFNLTLPDIQFWKYEWDKHGACMEPTMGLKDYFAKTTALFRSLTGPQTVWKTLETAGIPRGSVHSYADLSLIIKNMEKKIIIQCAKILETIVILEVRFCVNEAATEIISCHNAALDKGCPRDAEAILFPEFEAFDPP